ncbi:hypothetical protein ABT84_06600 [Salmonella enterica subsp. enterica serovar Typhimurium]|nr:hypothetical protein ABT84_06600 [Salmonella enterica subsp. enterica serovar Typhimurium]
MSPSRGDALFCCVKRSASRQNTVAFLLLLEEPDADKSSHSITLWCRVPPGAWRRLHTRRVGIHRRSTVSLNLNPRALSRIHHNDESITGVRIERTFSLPNPPH